MIISAILDLFQKSEWKNMNEKFNFKNARLHVKGHTAYKISLDGSAAAKSLQLCLTLCNPIDGSPPASPVPGILQTRTLEGVAISFSNAWKWKVKVKSLSRVLTLRDPMDCTLPGSCVHGIFQARVLEWSATAFSLNGSTFRKINLY